MPTLVTNKRARFDYDILETLEAGIVLSGQEVKSARRGNVSLKGAYVTLRQAQGKHGAQGKPGAQGKHGAQEAWLTNAHIGAYEKAGPLPQYDPARPRKLLLTKKELKRLLGKRREAGLTLLPLSLYTTHHRIKVGVGLGRGKKQYEKRESIKKRETDRTIREKLKTRV